MMIFAIHMHEPTMKFDLQSLSYSFFWIKGIRWGFLGDFLG